MTTRFIDHLLTGDHASRPAASAVPQGTLYACSTHGKVYQSDGSSTWSDWQSSVANRSATLQNEVKGWPPLVQIGSGFDLVTNNQWWDDEGTPTTKATAVPSSGEAGLDAKFTEVIKCVTDAVDEGFNQRYTYADEPRIKSGAVISALLWVATTSGGSGITVKLRNSGGSSTSGSVVATDGDWSLIVVEDHTCSGTYVELVVTKDASGTFYAGGPITVMVGADATALPQRGLRYVYRDPVLTLDLANAADPNTWTDEDITGDTSNLAVIAQLHFRMRETDASTTYLFDVRRNGSSKALATDQAIAVVQVSMTELRAFWNQLLDDGQVFEYILDRIAGASNLDVGSLYVDAWWEWE